MSTNNPKESSSYNPKESSSYLPAEVTENDVENFLTVPAGTPISLPLLFGCGFTTLLLSQIPGCTPQVQKDVSEATPTLSSEITSELTSKQYLLAQDFVNFGRENGENVGIPFTSNTQLVTIGCNFPKEDNQEVPIPLPFALADPESQTTLGGESFGLIVVREKGPDGQEKISALAIARENKERKSQKDPFFNYTVFIWEEGVFKSMSTNERIVVKEDNHLYLVDENNNPSLIGIPSDREIHPRICQQATFDVTQLPPISPTVKDSDQPILVATLSQVQQIDLSTDPSMLLAQALIISDISPHPSSPSSPTPTPISKETITPTPESSYEKHPYYDVFLTKEAKTIDGQTIHYAPLFEIYGKEYPLGIVEEEEIVITNEKYGIEKRQISISAISTGEIVTNPIEIEGRMLDVYYLRVLVPTGPNDLLTPALVSIIAQDSEGEWTWKNRGVFIVNIQNDRMVNTLNGVKVPVDKFLEEFQKTRNLQLLFPEVNLEYVSPEDKVIRYLRSLASEGLISEEKISEIKALGGAEVDPNGGSARSNYENLIKRKPLPPDFYLGNIGVVAMPLSNNN